MCTFITDLMTFVLLPFAVSAYASIVVSRIYQFYDSKKDAWETIISMEHALNAKSPTLQHPWASARLNSPAQRMQYFGHLKAYRELTSIIKDMEEELQKAENKHKAGDTSSIISRDDWEKRIVGIRYDILPIFQPWPKKF